MPDPPGGEERPHRALSASHALTSPMPMRQDERPNSVLRYGRRKTMPRRNLDGHWGENTPISVRMSPRERRELRHLCEQWGCTTSAAIRRAVSEAAQRVPTTQQEKER